MPSSYSPNLRIELIASGEQSNTWGNTTNVNLGTLIEQSICGYVSLNSMVDANYTLTALNGASDQARQMFLDIPAGTTLSATRFVIAPAVSKVYVVRNNSTGGQSVTIATATSGVTGVTIPNGRIKMVACDGTNFTEVVTSMDKLYLDTAITYAGSAANQAVTKTYVDSGFLRLAGNNTVTGNTTFSGTVTLPSSTPTGYQATSFSYVNTNYLWKAAGVSSQNMYPYLRLQYTPVDPSDAVPKTYVDSNFVTVNNSNQSIAGVKTFTTGLALSGAGVQLTLPNAPVSGTDAANKAYVDGSVSNFVTISGAGQTITSPKTFNNTLSMGSGYQIYLPSGDGTAGAAYAINRGYIDSLVPYIVPTSRTISAGSPNVYINGVPGGSTTLASNVTIDVAAVTVPVTGVGGVAPIQANGISGSYQTGNIAISMSSASGSSSGYLVNTDWTTFNNKCNANGSNASGSSWNISILGSAASAGSVAWSGITNIPGTFPGGCSGASTSCTGNAATATTAAACSGNSATATTAGSCSGNSATATTASNANALGGLGPGSYALNSSLSGYLPLVGGTMSGSLLVNTAGGSTSSWVSAASVGGTTYGLIGSYASTSSGYAPFILAQQNTSGGTPQLVMNATTVGDANFYHNLSCVGTKPFRINHPIIEGKKLYHIAVEAPRADLIYRGVVSLIAGTATITIDDESRLTSGTFVALTQNVEVVSLHNKNGFTRVKASEVINGQFTITAEDSSCEDDIVWVVMAERNDESMHNNRLADEYGRIIPEHEEDDPL